jgi:small-conductance mechanosensitive channel
MYPEFEPLSITFEIIRVVSIIIVSGLAGWLVFLGMTFGQRKLTKRGRWKLTPKLLGDLSKMIFGIIIVEGLFIGLSSLSVLENALPTLQKINVSFLIILGAYGFANVAGTLFYWHLRRIGVRKKDIDEGLSLFLRRTIVVLVYIAALLSLLNYLGVSINAALAGLGIGGLAIALALQPTLGNFFAGSQIVSDRIIRTDDFIELDSGLSGYVVDIGWRSTKIRTVFNNMVIIPNSKLADSVITNYYVPDKEMGVAVEVGVSYGSNLKQVKKVATEVAYEVIEQVPEAVKTRDPWLWYQEFDDSNVNLRLYLYAVDRLGTFIVRTELMERLHARFKKKGITINYPVRQITKLEK